MEPRLLGGQHEMPDMLDLTFAQRLGTDFRDNLETGATGVHGRDRRRASLESPCAVRIVPPGDVESNCRRCANQPTSVGCIRAATSRRTYR